MTRNLKALGLALLAAFALSAVAASAASANNDTFTSDSSTETTDLTGATVGGVDPVLTSPGTGDVKCSEGTYAGTVDGNDVDEITVHPTYHGLDAHEGDCTVLGGEETAKVDTHGCDYVLTGETHEGDATVYIECTEGHEIEIQTTELGITIDIPAQGPLTGVRYEEKGETITVEATVEGIEYNCTGALCFLLENGGSGNDASYTDDVLTSGYVDTGDFTMDETTHTWSGTHGAKVDLGVHTEVG